LAKSLMGLTDLLLVGFFLGIGLQGLPNWQEVAVRVFLFCFCRSRLRCSSPY